LLRKKFQGEDPVKAGVPRHVNDTHAPATVEFADSVVGYRLSDKKSQYASHDPLEILTNNSRESQNASQSSRIPEITEGIVG
jgi:hypothetical protein